eukprot:2386079-Amphidinium_carterae.2
MTTESLLPMPCTMRTEAACQHEYGDTLALTSDFFIHLFPHRTMHDYVTVCELAVTSGSGFRCNFKGFLIALLLGMCWKPDVMSFVTVLASSPSLRLRLNFCLWDASNIAVHLTFGSCSHAHARHNRITPLSVRYSLDCWGSFSVSVLCWHACMLAQSARAASRTPAPKERKSKNARMKNKDHLK